MVKRRGKATIVLLLLGLVALILYLNISDRSVKKTPESQQLYTIEKTGAGTVIDYTATAKRVHAAIDTGLLGGKYTAQTFQEDNREVPRQTVEGIIRWHARRVLVTVADGTKSEEVRQAVADALKNSGGTVLGSQTDTYQSAPAVRLDIGVHDTLAGEPLTLITDRLYIVNQGKAGLPPPPKTAGAGQLAIIIDDFGYSAEPIEALAAITRPLTFSVLPNRPYSGEAASRALSSGHQVMLHLPMEPFSANQLEPSTITTGMSDQEIKQVAAKAIQAVPGIVGVNNHEGSKATSDRRVMRAVLGVLKADSLFFVDSRTSGQSVAFELSRQMGLRTGENELFLDNDNNVEYVKSRLRNAIHLAVQNGSVTVIGHARMTTATAIREMIPEIEAAGVRLVFVSQLVK